MSSSRLALLLFSVAYAAAQPPVVHVRLTTVGNQTQFRIGQPIPVTLDFETDSRQSLPIGTDVRLRHLKPQGPDVFSATPGEGWADPLEHLHWTMDASISSAGPAMANLDAAHPVRIERDLNEFVVFRQPGRYLIHAVSTRVAGQQLQSNGLALDILPRDNDSSAHEWEAAKAVLEMGTSSGQPGGVRYPEQENTQIDAVRRLRYLETPAAAEYLASIYGGRGGSIDQEIEMALYSSPYADAAANKLEQRIGDPELSISQAFTSTLYELKARALSLRTGRPFRRKSKQRSTNRSTKRSSP